MVFLLTNEMLYMSTVSIFGFYEPISSWSHLLTAFAGFIGLYFLLKRGKGNLTRQLALLVFSISIIFLFSMSGVFHLLYAPSMARDVLQRLDHAGIWTLIAGTFTPIHIILFRGPWRWIPLTAIWVMAITGLVLQVIFFTSFPQWLVLLLFLGLGWFGCFSMYKFKKLYRDPTIWFLFAGGIFYSIGAIIDFMRWPVIWLGVLGPHEIFHLFVIMGVASHWWFIYKWADHPITNDIMFLVQIFPNHKYVAEANEESIAIEASSLEDLKKQATAIVKKRFHHSIKPRIRLRYFNEEHLH